MTTHRGLRAIAVAALIAAALTSCAKNASDPAVNGSPTPSSSAPTTTPRSESETASATASAIVRDYYGTLDKVRQQVDLPLSRLSSVATSVELSSLKSLVETERAKGQRQTGTTEIAELEVQSVNLDNSNPAAGKVPSVQVDVCWNVTDVDIVDEKGRSIVSPDRPNTGWTRFTVANHRYTSAPEQGWRVATSQDLTRKPCAAS